MPEDTTTEPTPEEPTTTEPTPEEPEEPETPADASGTRRVPDRARSSGGGSEITRDALKGMTPSQINEAFEAGELNHLL